MEALENPVWEALNSIDKRFNLGDDIVSYFDETVSPFVGLSTWDDASQQYAMDILPEGRSWSVMVSEPVTFSNNINIVFSIPLYQMDCSDFIPIQLNGVDVRPLTALNVPEMLVLTELTKPGPFLDRTIDFGNYIGLFENNKLVAMAGERLHLNTHTEISAVCTDPKHLGKGYGAHLVSILCTKIIKGGRTPFLHVRQDNLRAIEMYKRLGFLIRTDMYFAVFKVK
jgi:ribosomal protein S18 acetylase RimI-like enzyme